MSDNSDFYTSQDLLDVLLASNSDGMQILSGLPPKAIIGEDEQYVQGPSVSIENVVEIFKSIATVDHQTELDRCGDVHFIFKNRGDKSFGITAKLTHGNISIDIRNLGKR